MNIRHLLKGVLYRLRKALDGWALSVCARSEVLAVFYYLVMRHAFVGEQYATLRGRREFQRRSDVHKGNAFHLRRCVHRLEKGLCMQPRKSHFALDYIGDTVSNYDALIKTARTEEQSLDSDTLNWARDVLTLYFDNVGEHPKIYEARRKFEAVPHPPCREHGKLVPFVCESRPNLSVNYEQLLGLAKRRRSIRVFSSGQSVDRGLIEKAVDVARESPSACNRQAFRFVICDEQELVGQVAAIPYGTTGFANGIPSLIVVVGDLSAYAEERDRHVIYIDASMASMALLLSLETLGLSSCCINWPDYRDKDAKIAKLLGLAPYQRVIMLIAVGHADARGLVPRSHKRSSLDLTNSDLHR